MTTKKSLKENKQGLSTKEITICGLFIALSMLFSYLEALIPVSIGIPGVKLGLANLVTIVAMYHLSLPLVFAIACIRVLLSSLLFSNMMVFVYSIAGAFFSILVMYIVKSFKCFSKVGVSVTGGVFHNVGQLVVAFLMLENRNVLYYAPVLVISGVVAGALIGLLASMIRKG